MEAALCGASMAGLYDELRSGRPRSIEDDRVAALLKLCLATLKKRYFDLLKLFNPGPINRTSGAYCPAV
jgi:hypothetical protein